MYPTTCQSPLYAEDFTAEEEMCLLGAYVLGMIAHFKKKFKNEAFPYRPEIIGFPDPQECPDHIRHLVQDAFGCWVAESLPANASDGSFAKSTEPDEALDLFTAPQWGSQDFVPDLPAFTELFGMSAAGLQPDIRRQKDGEWPPHIKEQAAQVHQEWMFCQVQM